MQHVAASSEACKVALQLVDIGAVSEGDDDFKCLLVYAMMSCKICIGSYKFRPYFALRGFTKCADV